MGYHMEFDGGFTLDRPLSVKHYKALVEAQGSDAIGSWEIDEDGEVIQCSEGNKFFDHAECLQRLVDDFLKPWGYTLDGLVSWQGEDDADFGVLQVKNNEVFIGRHQTNFECSLSTTLTHKEQIAINTACRVLSELARRTGVERVEVRVQSDGNVAFYGESDPTKVPVWISRGDLNLPQVNKDSGSLTSPAQAVIDVINGDAASKKVGARS